MIVYQFGSRLFRMFLNTWVEISDLLSTAAWPVCVDDHDCLAQFMVCNDSMCMCAPGFVLESAYNCIPGKTRSIPFALNILQCYFLLLHEAREQCVKTPMMSTDYCLQTHAGKLCILDAWNLSRPNEIWSMLISKRVGLDVILTFHRMFSEVFHLTLWATLSIIVCWVRR